MIEPRPGERVFFHGHPSWRSMLGLYLKGVALAVVLGALAGALTGIAGRHVSTLLVTAVVLAVLAVTLALAAARRRATTYTVTDRRLTIERGLLSRDSQETRLERVQNVGCRQSLLERLLLVGTVEFDTAAGADYDFTFRGVERPREIARTVDRALHELQRPDPYELYGGG